LKFSIFDFFNNIDPKRILVFTYLRGEALSPQCWPEVPARLPHWQCGDESNPDPAGSRAQDESERAEPKVKQ